MAAIFKLLVKSGNDENKIYLLDKKKITIGRDPKCDFVIDDIQISRNHLRIFVQGNKVLLEDLNSTNGTFVNGNRLENKTIVSDGDLIRVGNNIVLELIQEKDEVESLPQELSEDNLPPVTEISEKRFDGQSSVDLTSNEQVIDEQTPNMPKADAQSLIDKPVVENTGDENAVNVQTQIEPNVDSQNLMDEHQAGKTLVENIRETPLPIEQDQTAQTINNEETLKNETASAVGEGQDEQLSKERKMPTWVLILLIALGFLVIFCLIPLLVIELTNQWCNLFAGFFNSMSPDVCP